MNEEMTRKFKKRDALFIIILLVIGIGAYALVQLGSRSDAGTVKVSVDGEEYAQYSLDKDQEIPIMIDGVTTNVLEIKDGYANMIDADCPDQLCVHQSHISKVNESIICLPNKVVIEITEGTQQEYDTIVR